MGLRESVRQYTAELEPQIRAVLEGVLELELEAADMERPRLRAAISQVIESQFSASKESKT